MEVKACQENMHKFRKDTQVRVKLRETKLDPEPAMLEYKSGPKPAMPKP